MYNGHNDQVAFCSCSDPEHFTRSINSSTVNIPSTNLPRLNVESQYVFEQLCSDPNINTTSRDQLAKVLRLRLAIEGFGNGSEDANIAQIVISAAVGLGLIFGFLALDNKRRLWKVL